MADQLRVLVDANVILDVLARREPHYTISAQVWAAAETGRITGLVAAHTVTTLYYLVARHTDRQRAVAAITDILRVFGVTPVNERVLLAALALDAADYEDAVQMAAAASAAAAYIVTRNPVDFRASPVTAILPADLAGLLTSL